MDPIQRITKIINTLTKTYAYSIQATHNPDEYRVVFSKPTNSNPLPNPVVNVYFEIAKKNEITFRIENRRFKYQNAQEVDFDKALNFVIDSKIVARSII
jgi:hypothetical protein